MLDHERKIPYRVIFRVKANKINLFSVEVSPYLYVNHLEKPWDVPVANLHF